VLAGTPAGHLRAPPVSPTPGQRSRRAAGGRRVSIRAECVRSPSTKIKQPGPVPVAFVRAVLGALVEPGSDGRGQLRVDELLLDGPDGLPDEVQALARLESIEQVGQDRLVKGHRCDLLQWVRLGTHRGSRRWPHLLVDTSAQLKAHHSRGRRRDFGRDRKSGVSNESVSSRLMCRYLPKCDMNWDCLG
jgi:hypothetical protein